MPDLLQGRVQVYFTPMAFALPYTRDHQLRPLATMAPERTSLVPDVPTLAELGVTAVSIPSWQAIFAPPRTNRQVVDAASRSIGAALRDSAVRDWYSRYIFRIDGAGPEALAGQIKADIAIWGQVIEENGITQE